MARTDALASEGLTAAIERSQRYVEAGADMVFAEAITDPDEYRQFTASIPVPVLANMTEFGSTPLMGLSQLRELGVAMVLYPLSAFRAMSRAAELTYAAIRRDGNQQAVLNNMQTRDELYKVLDYHRYEQVMDQILEKGRI